MSLDVFFSENSQLHRGTTKSLKKSICLQVASEANISSSWETWNTDADISW